MYEYSRRSINRSKGLQLHSVLRQFKKFQQEKKILQNRINIMHNNEVKNKNKVKIIQGHLYRIKNAHQARVLEKKNMSVQIFKHIDNQISKKKQGIKKIKEEMKNVQNSKKSYREHKLRNVRKARSESRLNVQKISQKKQQLLRLNKKRKQLVNQSQWLGRTKVSVFRQKKLSSIKRQQNQRLLSQMSINETSRMQVSALQKLQRQMIMKYSQSLKSLETSRAKFVKASMLRF